MGKYYPLQKYYIMKLELIQENFKKYFKKYLHFVLNRDIIISRKDNFSKRASASPCTVQVSSSELKVSLKRVDGYANILTQVKCCIIKLS